MFLSQNPRPELQSKTATRGPRALSRFAPGYAFLAKYASSRSRLCVQPGSGFGSNFNDRDQVRGLLETGILF